MVRISVANGSAATSSIPIRWQPAADAVTHPVHSVQSFLFMANLPLPKQKRKNYVDRQLAKLGRSR
jgi:hypothetical protein